MSDAARRLDLAKVRGLGEAEHGGIAVREPGQRADRAGRKFHAVETVQRCTHGVGDHDLDRCHMSHHQHALTRILRHHVLEGLTARRGHRGRGQPFLQFDRPTISHLSEGEPVPVPEGALGEPVDDLDIALERLRHDACRLLRAQER